ncbi:MAG: circularly permuted type 2 ATP-grasp protein [Solirubrobacterales bacterium]
MQQVSVSRETWPGYAPEAGGFDEAFDENGHPRPHYAAILRQLAELDLAELKSSAQAEVDRRGVAFTTTTGTQPFTVDPVPRVIPADEWRLIATGVAQRTRALNEFVLDAYGEQRIVAAGILPEGAIESAEYFEPDLVGTSPPAGIFTNLAGLDLVRGGDGVLRVLEDNVRSPSGLTFSIAARQMSDAAVPFTGGQQKLPAGDEVFAEISAALHAAAPESAGDEPAIALVTDGPTSAAWFEHKRIADALDIYLFALDQLENHGGAVYGRDDDGLLKPIDVIYRRTDLDRLRLASGALSHFGELMLEPIREGSVACVNAFGSGIADDKLIHAYVEQMISFYLAEDPLLESVQTYDPADPATGELVASRADELVFKPRGGLGGKGVTIGRAASADELAAAVRTLEEAPEDWVVQETVSLSTHPTVIDGALEPRRIDLRPYAIHLGDSVRTLPACLTRVAMQRGGLIVNSSQNGGAKDTWVVAE